MFTVEVLRAPVLSKGASAHVHHTLAVERSIEANASLFVRNVQVHDGAEEPVGGREGGREEGREGSVVMTLEASRQK